MAPGDPAPDARPRPDDGPVADAVLRRVRCELDAARDWFRAGAPVGAAHDVAAVRERTVRQVAGDLADALSVAVRRGRGPEARGLLAATAAVAVPAALGPAWLTLLREAHEVVDAVSWPGDAVPSAEHGVPTVP